MNYYDELGIHPDAPLEEIRQAYRVLARLLHPDGQPDARLKAMAECQMKRLNEMLETLTDSQKRREYNESLFATPKAALECEPAEVPSRPAYWYQAAYFGVRHWFWILVGVVVAGVAIWCMEQGNPPVSQLVPSYNGAVSDKADSAELRDSGPRAQVPRKTVKPTVPRAAPAPPSEKPPSDTRQVAVQSVATAEPKPAAPSRVFPTQQPAPPNPIVLADPPQVAPQAATLAPPIPIASSHETSFAGDWFYAPENAGKVDPNLYPAAYVEFVLAEESGTLVGNYRAKYKIPDQAISSEVQFRVQGKSPAGKSCRLTWASEDGAQGEAELTLSSSDRMKLTWWTTVFGRRAALSSGVAVLTRQQAP